MGSIADSTAQALTLLFGGDPDLWEIIGISFKVSLTAIALATPVAIGIAFLLAFGRFPGRRLLIAAFNTLLSFPAVVVGLTLYILLSRQGPLGEWQLLFTQPAMVLGQIALALPILVAMGHSSLQATDRRAWETARTLGAGRIRAMFTLMREARFGLSAALLAGFGTVIVLVSQATAAISSPSLPYLIGASISASLIATVGVYLIVFAIRGGPNLGAISESEAPLSAEDE